VITLKNIGMDNRAQLYAAKRTETLKKSQLEPAKVFVILEKKQFTFFKPKLPQLCSTEDEIQQKNETKELDDLTEILYPLKEESDSKKENEENGANEFQNKVQFSNISEQPASVTSRETLVVAKHLNSKHDDYRTVVLQVSTFFICIVRIHDFQLYRRIIAADQFLQQQYQMTIFYPRILFYHLELQVQQILQKEEEIEIINS
jgi:hypothetical protein